MTATLSGATSQELLGTVGEAMTAEVVVLHTDTPADVAMRRLEHSRVSGAPVVDHGRVVGVVTLRDLQVPCWPRGPSRPPARSTATSSSCAALRSATS
jgi:CBS-domain-containing membrane protein